MQELMPEMFSRSHLMILDFSEIPTSLPKEENIQLFFADCRSRGLNPRDPAQRQAFNNRMLDATGSRYLVSRYAEDRQAMLQGSEIARQGRTYHLGVDVFSRDLEPVFAPSNGRVVRIGQEPENHSFGYYLFFAPDDADYYILFGHLAKPTVSIGHVSAGQQIATLGDFAEGTNGGWSRHLHIQLFSGLPLEHENLVGYATKAQLNDCRSTYPDPMSIFRGWNVERTA